MTLRDRIEAALLRLGIDNSRGKGYKWYLRHELAELLAAELAADDVTAELAAACEASMTEFAAWHDDIATMDPMSEPAVAIWQQCKSALARYRAAR